MTKQKIINCLGAFFFWLFQFLEEILTNDNDSNCWSRHPNGETLFYIAFAKNTFFSLFLQFILDLKTKKNIHTIQSMQFFNDKTFVGHFCNL